jgi:hypothetical protein
MKTSKFMVSKCISEFTGAAAATAFAAGFAGGGLLTAAAIPVASTTLLAGSMASSAVVMSAPTIGLASAIAMPVIAIANPGRFKNFWRPSKWIFNPTFPDQTSHSWFFRTLFSLHWAISENAETNRKFGIILHIGFGLKNSTLQLPGVSEPLNGLMIDYIAKVGIYL